MTQLFCTGRIFTNAAGHTMMERKTVLEHCIRHEVLQMQDGQWVPVWYKQSKIS